MKAERVHVAVAGVLFLIAMVASLVGGGMIESVVDQADGFVDLPGNAILMTGVILEFINAIAVVVIGFILFSVLKRQSEVLALGYVSFRIIESVLLIIAAVLPLSLIALGRPEVTADALNVSGSGVLGGLVVSVRADVMGLLVPLFFGLGALLFYSLLYRSSLVPRFISVWGIIGVALMWLMNVLQVGTAVAMFLVAPLILNEIFLGLWLMIRGVEFAADTSGAASFGLPERGTV